MGAERLSLLPGSENDLFRSKPIVITGMGMVSPLGLSVADSWRPLINGESGLSSREYHKLIKATVFGIVEGFEPTDVFAGFVNKKGLTKRTPRVAQFSTMASNEALMQAELLTDEGFLIGGIDPKRVGVVIGTGYGGAANIVDIENSLSKDERILATTVLHTLVELVATVPSMTFGLKGPVFAPVAACATGNVSIIAGVEKLLLGQADIMLVGGAEASLRRAAIEAFDAMPALSRETNPEKASRPFDKDRDGFVYGEGAGVLVLESQEHARRRGATILAYVGGYGQLSDAGHATNPDGPMQVQTMKNAMRGLRFPEKGTIYVNAHGTATENGDPVEITSIKEAVADHFDTVVSSTKGATGHLLGAAGGVETIFCLEALRTGFVPPTVHNDNKIDEAKGINIVPNNAQTHNPIVAINNSFGFGGLNAVVLFSKDPIEASS